MDETTETLEVCYCEVCQCEHEGRPCREPTEEESAGTDIIDPYREVMG